MLSGLLERVIRRLKRYIYKPRISVQPLAGLVTLGTHYGGWTFRPSTDLTGATIVSCGLGEDASFDVEFAARFGAKIIIVDPTPRAIAHFLAIQQRIGEAATGHYVEGGNQPVTAYDLSKLSPDSLVLEASAVWSHCDGVKFFAPSNPASVSHSIVNFKNDYAQDTPAIEVPSITPDKLLEKYGIADLPLIKFDIEGAEGVVIDGLLLRNIFPRQLLVEFDELAVPSPHSKGKAEEIDRKLRGAGYACRHYDGLANFLYILQ